MAISLTLLLVDSHLSVARLPAGAGLPWWAATSGFLSVTRTPEETSVVCDAEGVPEGARAERGFRALRVAGTVPFSANGVLAAIATPLASARIPIFVVSTFDTDYVLVRESELENAVAALRAAGHVVKA
jgi:hypothetical protein